MTGAKRLRLVAATAAAAWLAAPAGAGASVLDVTIGARGGVADQIEGRGGAVPVSVAPPLDAVGGRAVRAAFGARTLVKIALANRRTAAAGPLAVRVSNANGFDVSGSLSGKATRGRSPAQRERRPRLAARSFTVPANARRTVRLRLPKALRRQFERTGTLSLRMTAKLRDPAGTTRTVSKTLRPRARSGRRETPR